MGGREREAGVSASHAHACLRTARADHPIVQAPMAAVPRLAAAVANAAALGMVTLTWSADAGEVVRETAALTDRPFGGNLVLISDHHRRVDKALAGLVQPNWP
jgi:nitronate monooxygenase